jgi:hypothetical protein
VLPIADLKQMRLLPTFIGSTGNKCIYPQTKVSTDIPFFEHTTCADQKLTHAYSAMPIVSPTPVSISQVS